MENFDVTNRDDAIRVMWFFLRALVIVVLWFRPAHADYEPLRLPELIGETELIVLGTISEVRENTFVLEDYDVVVGAHSDGPLEVKRFVDWSGASRWMKYRVGQTMLLFLVAPEAGAKGKIEPWRIRGIGGEGEMPVAGGFIYIQGPLLRRSDIQKYVVDQKTFYGHRFDLKVFISAVKGYKRCFRFVKTEVEKRSRTVLRLCDDETLETYGRESELHCYLVEITK